MTSEREAQMIDTEKNCTAFEYKGYRFHAHEKTCSCKNCTLTRAKGYGKPLIVTFNDWEEESGWYMVPGEGIERSKEFLADFIIERFLHPVSKTFPIGTT